jgi:hypothetical protein
MRLLGSFEALLQSWQAAGAKISSLAAIRDLGLQRPVPDQAVMMGEIPGRSGLLAVQPP